MEVIHTAAPRITPSSINDLECAKKFYTLRIARRWPDREPFYTVAIGTAVHEVLRNLYRNRKGSEIDLSNLLALTKTAVYHVRFPKDANLIEAAQKVMNCVRTYVNNDDDEDIEGTIDVERESEFPLIHEGKMLCLVSAKLDRIVVRASNPTVLVVNGVHPLVRQTVKVVSLEGETTEHVCIPKSSPVYQGVQAPGLARSDGRQVPGPGRPRASSSPQLHP